MLQAALRNGQKLLAISCLNFDLAQSGKRMAQSDARDFDPVYFKRTGQPSTENEAFKDLSKFIEGVRHSGKRGVLFVGEVHYNIEGHKLELKILENIFESATKQNLKIGFALEMYDRAAQPVLDEYVAGLLDYEAFLREVGSSAPGNHESYRPLLEFCRSRRIPVTGSNCPRRYSRLVAKNGREILTTLPEGSRKLIAPVTYRDASDDYRRNFLNAMNVVHRDEVALDDRMVKMLDSQTLWDSTMAFSIFESLKTCEIIFHLSGYFHVQNDLGIVEHLRRLDEDVECRSVVILPDENPHLDETNRNLADWIVVTDINRE